MRDFQQIFFLRAGTQTVICHLPVGAIPVKNSKMLPPGLPDGGRIQQLILILPRNSLHINKILFPVNLVADMGNTFTKIGLFQQGKLLETAVFGNVETEALLNFCSLHPEISRAIVSSVKDLPATTTLSLQKKFPVLVFGPLTPVPVTNRYETPATLGSDRLAAVVAARQRFPRSAVLVIDAGTAITYELLTAAGEYLGGAISPGIGMRYKALHTFTGRLPLLSTDEECLLTGSTTAGSIHSGVMNGTLAEVHGMIARYRKTYPRLKLVLTGGDYKYFAKQLKIKTFAAPNLVLEGLNLILDFNFETI